MTSTEDSNARRINAMVLNAYYFGSIEETQ